MTLSYPSGGKTGPQGPQGPTGPQGPAGPTGPQGPSGEGTGNSLNTPKVVGTDGLQYYYPRISVTNRATVAMGKARALPLSFDKETIIRAIHVPYFGNCDRNGVDGIGQNVANPGWNVKAFIYSADAVTGLPLEYIAETDGETIQPLDNGGSAVQAAYLSFPTYLTVYGNTPIWVLIVSQPVFDVDFPNGWEIGVKYKYVDGAWTEDETGAYIGGPRTLEAYNQLAPISDLPATPWLHDVYGIELGHNALYYPYTVWAEGATPAEDLTTYTAFEFWPSSTYEWLPFSGNNITASHSPVGSAVTFYAEASDSTWVDPLA